MSSVLKPSIFASAILGSIFSVNVSATEFTFDENNVASGTYMCAEGEACTVVCEGEKVCTNSNFYAANNYDFTLICNGREACSKSSFYGPEEGNFEVSANDSLYSFFDSTIRAETSNFLNFDLNNTKYFSHYLKIHAPREVFIANDTWITGDDHNTQVWFPRFIYSNTEAPYTIYMDLNNDTDFADITNNGKITCLVDGNSQQSELTNDALQLCNVDVKAISEAQMPLVGLAGLQGAQGIQGANGLDGATGAQGANGLDGATGAQGANGLDGATGAQGIKGDTGAQGIKGDNGDDFSGNARVTVLEAEVADLKAEIAIIKALLEGDVIDGLNNCANVQAWDASQGWTEYSIGDVRTDTNGLWTVTNVAYSIYQPSSGYGVYGWRFVEACR
jgi:hypothetical protein